MAPTARSQVILPIPKRKRLQHPPESEPESEYEHEFFPDKDKTDKNELLEEIKTLNQQILDMGDTMLMNDNLSNILRNEKEDLLKQVAMLIDESTKDNSTIDELKEELVKLKGLWFEFTSAAEEELKKLKSQVDGLKEELEDARRARDPPISSVSKAEFQQLLQDVINNHEVSLVDALSRLTGLGRCP